MKLSVSNLLLAAFTSLVLVMTVWLLWPTAAGSQPAAFFLPTPSPTLTRVVVHREPTPTAFVPTPTPAPVMHEVKGGEVLGVIAAQYGVSVEAIVQANKLENAHTVRAGQMLVIPGLVATPVPPASAMPTATPSPLIYTAPALLTPPGGDRFVGADAKIDLQWASVGILKEGEWYQVKLWIEEPDEAERFWVKTTTLTVPATLYPKKETSFHWDVTVVYKGRKIIPLSPAEEPRAFSWR